ncbi:MAG: hypothetical protein ACI909_001335 [Planctomycetota bacterium]|jgi:hypothetical protein
MYWRGVKAQRGYKCRHNKGEEHRRARHELMYATTASNGAQHDQAISKNAGENPQRRLRDTAAHEVPQNARGVLARRQYQCQQGHGEGDTHIKPVIIEPADVDNIWRAPSAPTLNSRGHWLSHWLKPAESASINTTAKAMLLVTISAGINQKLDRRSPPKLY